MNYTEIIVSNYKVMLGKPVIKGTRITVEQVLKKLSEGASVNEVVQMYPNLSQPQVMACLEYAHDIIAKEELITVTE